MIFGDNEDEIDKIIKAVRSLQPKSIVIKIIGLFDRDRFGLLLLSL